MKQFLFVCALVALLIGCESAKAPKRPAELPVRYHNSQYGLTFWLPAEWRGYSVLMNEWRAELPRSASDDSVFVRGPTIILRHPQWTTAKPYQDIPIMVFTRNQWDADKQGKFSIGAGGIDEEICHNHKYVFATSSRFSWGEAIDWLETARIVDQNREANAPHLYPE